MIGAGRAVPAARSVQGSVQVPGDKSISHRAALFNALGEGRARISNFSPGADCASTLQCLRDLGVDARHDGDCVDVVGRGLRGFDEPANVLDCGNSGTSMRLLSGVLAGSGVFAVLTGDDSLRSRPMARIVEPLRTAGARIDGREGGRLAPLVISPVERVHAVEHRLSVASAQVKSALLLAGLFADGPTTVIEPAATRDHTERMLRAMGGSVQEDGLRRTLTPGRLRCVDVEVPGDFSSAAFWLVLGVLHPRAQVRIRNIGLNLSRTGLLTILRRMGAHVEIDGKRDVAGEPVADLVAWSSELRATDVDGDLVPLAIDEISLVALLGLFAEGETVVRDASELRTKESDRLAVTADALRANGVAVEIDGDDLIVPGGGRPAGGGVVATHMDHRIAMGFLVMGLASERPVAIDDVSFIATSFPGYVPMLRSLGAELS